MNEILEKVINENLTSKLKELKKIDVLIMDLETLHTFEEVGSVMLLGVSVLVFYSTKSNKYYVFTEEDLSDRTKEQILCFLNNADAIVGYNILNFDYEVLAGVLGKRLHYLKQKTVDFYHQILIKHSIWSKENEMCTKEYCRVKLTSLARFCLGVGDLKSLPSGVEAVKLWRSGIRENREKVIEYCKRDVLITRAIFEYSLLNGGRIKFLNPVQIKRLKAKLPLTRRLITTCVIDYPPVLQPFVKEQKKKKPAKQYKLF